MPLKSYYFVVDHPGDFDAGIRSFSERVQIILESGNAGGGIGEFESFMCDVLSGWYKGAEVIIEENPERLKSVEERDWEDYVVLVSKIEGIDPNAAKWLRTDVFEREDFIPCAHLDICFNWDKTPQGYLYWRDIDLKVRNS